MRTTHYYSRLLTSSRALYLASAAWIVGNMVISLIGLCVLRSPIALTASTGLLALSPVVYKTLARAHERDTKHAQDIEAYAQFIKLLEHMAAEDAMEVVRLLHGKDSRGGSLRPAVPEPK